ncbi:MAG: SGNH/GDSL hydrolase family protein [Planctomycetia bacterium]|nr:SGNH/GDSL hydrolase family protein [Planctomycetia bacterium]
MGRLLPIFIISILFCVISDFCTGSEDAVFKIQPSIDFSVRDGIGNTLEKLRADKDVNVAYLGGSITMANGWRPKTTKWLQETWPKAKIHEIHAAISGTGSMLGNYRLQHDVLKYKPDLLFVEFAVNDGGTPFKMIWKQMEGIVRKTWISNPKTDIVFVYTFCVPFTQRVQKGELPDSASAMEILAGYYRIPSINFMNRVVKMHQEGTLIFQSKTDVPNGILCFSKDGTHPGDEGHELYLTDIKRGFDAMKDLPPVDHQVKLEKMFTDAPIMDTNMYPITRKMLKGNWRKLTPKDPFYHFTNRLDEIWTTDEPGASLSFRFKGSELLLYDIVGPDAGSIQITLDGKKREKLVPRFDSYCINHYSFRITTYTIASDLDPEKIHTVLMELDGSVPDRKPFANPNAVSEKDLKSPKYQGRRLRLGKILIRGTLLP